MSNPGPQTLGPLWITLPDGTQRPVPPVAPVLVGSDPRCDVVLPFAGVAPAHLELQPTSAGWILRHLGAPAWLGARQIDRPMVVDAQIDVVLGQWGAALRIQPHVWVPRGRRLTPTTRVLLMVAAVLVALCCGISAAVGPVDDEAAADTTSAPTPTTADTRPLVDRLPTTPPSVEAKPAGTYEGLYDGNPSGAGVPALLDALFRDVDAYWQEVFASSGLPPLKIRAVWPEAGAQVSSACTVPHDDETAAYCPADRTIDVAVPMAVVLYLGQLNTNSDGYTGSGGEGALLQVVAHEYGHGIQMALGLTYGPDAQELVPSVARELHADCLAGVWANAAWRAGSVSQTDLDEAGATLARIGDYEVTDADHHGTPDERVAAFNDGLKGGVVASCAPLLDKR